MQGAAAAQVAHAAAGAGRFRDFMLGFGFVVRADGGRQSGHLESDECQKQKGDLGDYRTFFHHSLTDPGAFANLLMGTQPATLKSRWPTCTNV